jgi:hypothetical protein
MSFTFLGFTLSLLVRCVGRAPVVPDVVAA